MPEELKEQRIEIEYMPLSVVEEWPGNPKEHADRDIQLSMGRFGYTEPLMIDERSGRLVHGHGRLENLLKMKKAGEEPPLRIVVEGDDWLVPVVRGVAFNSESEAKAYVLTANKLTEKGGWDEAKRDQILAELLEEGGEEALDGTGFEKEEVADLLEQADEEGSDGSLLSALDVSLGTPRHAVEKGDVWSVGPHFLICCEVMTDWPLWVPFLNDPQTIFAPYPGPFVPLTARAEEHTIIMVQPDTYIAGHILDRYEEIHGEESVNREQ